MLSTRAALAAVALLASVPVFADSTGTWSVIPPPAARHSHTAVMDHARDRVIVFAGDDGERSQDTWVIRRADDAWERLLTTGTAPSPRSGHTAIVDPLRDRMIVYGQTTGIRDQVWALALSGAPAWSSLGATGVQLPRGLHDHSAIYDPVRDRMLVFGGYSDFHHAQVWALSLSTTPPVWSLLATAGTAPPARRQHTAIYDPVRDRMIVFGGFDNTVRGDLWALELAGTPTWTPLAPVGTPPSARYGHDAVYDPARDAMLVLGGRAGGDTLLADAWQLGLAGAGEWTALSAGGAAPSPRYRHAMALDTTRDELIVIAGSDPNLKNDVWALSLAGTPQWRDLIVISGPARRNGPAVTFDPAGNRLVVFGGWADANRNDTRQFLFGGPVPRWSGVTIAERPPERANLQAVYDAARHRMIVVGGTPTIGDVWALDLASNTWSLLDPGPGAGIDFFPDAVAFDPRRRHLWAYGYVLPGNYAEIWRLDLSGPTPAWELIQTRGDVPPYGYGLEWVVDPVRDRLIAVSPIDYDATSTIVRELRLWDPTTWFVVPVEGTPPPGRLSATLIYDPVRDRVVRFGGSPRPHYPEGRAWALTLHDTPRWSELPELPLAFFGHATVYDPARDRMLSFQGNVTVALEWGEPMRPTALCPDTVTLARRRAQTARASSYRVANPAATARAISWSVRSARGWPGFPLHGVVVVPGASTGAIEIDVPLPDSAAPGDGALVFAAAFTGAEGYETTCAQRVDLVTATQAALVTATYRDGAARVAWELPSYESYAIRRRRDDGAWTPLAARWPDGLGRIELEDRDVAAGSRYRYRLTRAGSDEPVVADALVEVPVLGRPSFLGVRPNPSPGAVALALELPRAADLEVELFDVRGRLVAQHRASLAAGPHTVPVRTPAPLAPGLYLVRATCGGERFAGRAVVVR